MGLSVVGIALEVIGSNRKCYLESNLLIERFVRTKFGVAGAETRTVSNSILGFYAVSRTEPRAASSGSMWLTRPAHRICFRNIIRQCWRS